jgi:hypothetical protein
MRRTSACSPRPGDSVPTELTSSSAGELRPGGPGHDPWFHVPDRLSLARRLRLTHPRAIPGSQAGRLPARPDAGRQLSAGNGQLHGRNSSHPAIWVAVNMSGPRAPHRRDALGDEVHAEDEAQRRHQGTVMHGEPFLRRVELRLGAIPPNEVGWRSPCWPGSPPRPAGCGCGTSRATAEPALPTAHPSSRRGRSGRPARR